MKRTASGMVILLGAAVTWAGPEIAPAPVKAWQPTDSQSLPPAPVVGEAPAPKKGLAGVWVRESEGMQIVLRLTETRATAELRVAAGDGRGSGLTFRLTADCAVSPDGMLFGYVTGSDVSCADSPKLATGLAAALRVVEDEPFRVRYRLDGNRLRLRDLRVKGVERLTDPAMVVLLTGEYRAAAGEVAPPKGPAGVSFYSPDPNERMQQLLDESEDLRQTREEFHRFWMNNQPSVLTYERLSGSVGPASTPAEKKQPEPSPYPK